jgi:hypothetical protein
MKTAKILVFPSPNLHTFVSLLLDIVTGWNTSALATIRDPDESWPVPPVRSAE